MKRQDSFFWHDYETFGTDPRRDRAAQFAGIRTDMDLNIIGEPLNIYCQQSCDYLPHPEACLVTGLTPELVNQQGLPEYQFVAQIHQALAQPGTCGVGYNTLRFDDEFTRNLLYRNFYDAYEREWIQGNSRWDIIDLVRAVHAFRPESLSWPKDEAGITRFKLELLSKENGLLHEAAHDAMSDVYATIALARLIKGVQPKLYEFAFSLRHKRRVQELLQVEAGRAVLHISSKYPAKKNCLALVVPLMLHPTNSNGVIVYDLSIDPEPLLSLPAMEIHRLIFSAQNALDEGETRIPLKTIHINRSPIVAPLSVLRTGDAERLQLDLERCKQHYEKIRFANSLPKKLTEVFSLPYESDSDDPDLALYSGGFFDENDKKQFVQIRKSSAEQLSKTNFRFIDSRLPDMLFRYRARNFPHSLNLDEQLRWLTFCRQRVLEGKQNSLTLDAYFDKITLLQESAALSHSAMPGPAFFESLRAYGKQIEHAVCDGCVEGRK